MTAVTIANFHGVISYLFNEPIMPLEGWPSPLDRVRNHLKTVDIEGAERKSAFWPDLGDDTLGADVTQTDKTGTHRLVLKMYGNCRWEVSMFTKYEPRGDAPRPPWDAEHKFEAVGHRDRIITFSCTGYSSFPASIKRWRLPGIIESLGFMT